MAVCPSCNAELADDAVLCVGCGFHLKEGTHLATAVGEAHARSDAPADDNPYRSPADGVGGVHRRPLSHPNYDIDTRVEHLEQRVRELERRVDATRLVAPDFFTRLLAVCCYAVLGYLLVVLIFVVLSAVFRAIL